MTTHCAAFKIGTESAGDFSAIRVSDCRVVEANLGAIKILSVDGANIRNVLVERIQVDDVDTPSCCNAICLFLGNLEAYPSHSTIMATLSRGHAGNQHQDSLA